MTARPARAVDGLGTVDGVGAIVAARPSAVQVVTDLEAMYEGQLGVDPLDAVGPLRLGMNLSDEVGKHRVCDGSLRRRPVMVTDVEIVRDAAPFGEQVQDLAPELGRIARSSHLNLLVSDTRIQKPRRRRTRDTPEPPSNPVRFIAAIEHQLSNGLIESTNTKIRLVTRMAFGFKSAEALIALAMLSLGGHRHVLPGRK